MSITLTKADGTTNVAYSLFRMEGDRAEYHSAAHDDVNADSLILQSKSPVRNGNYLGNRKSTVKLVQTVDVTGADATTIKSDARISVDASIPVGMSDSARADLVSMLASGIVQSLIEQALLEAGQIQH